LTKRTEYVKFGGMKRTLITILVLFLIQITRPFSAQAFWVWTPETNKWVNPKYAVKDTPSEQLDFALDFYAQKDYDKAERELRKLLKHYPRAREAPDAQYYIAEIAIVQGKLLDAFRKFQMVIDKYPFSERSAEIVEKQYNIGLEILEGRSQRGGFIDAFIGDNYDVIEIFRAVIKNAPYGKFAAPAQYKIGLYLAEKRLYQEARDEFEKVINDYPDSEWTKAAKYQIATMDAQRSTDAQYDQQITQAAVEEFEEFVENYPDAQLSDDAKDQINQLRDKEAENNFLIGQFYEKQKNYTAAKIYYQAIVDEYRTSPWSSKALKKISEIGSKK